MCLNVSRKISLLKLLSKYVSRTGLTQYYNSYILPILDYGCLIWGRCSATNIKRILRLQKRAARIVLNADFTTSSKSIFMELKWLPFLERVKYHPCVMMYKAINNKTPEYISNMFSKSVDIHGRNLRSADRDMLRVPYAATQYYENSKNRWSEKLKFVAFKQTHDFIHRIFQEIFKRVLIVCTVPAYLADGATREHKVRGRGMLSGHWFPPNVLCSAMCYFPRCIVGMDVLFGSVISKYNTYKYHSDLRSSHRMNSFET